MWYILDKRGIPIFCGDIHVYKRWVQEYSDGRHNISIDDTTCWGHRVSTIFMGLDYSFGGPLPICFETMVFPEGKYHDLWCERRYSLAEALESHDEACRWAWPIWDLDRMGNTFGLY